MMGFDQQHFVFWFFPLIFPFVLFDIIIKAIALWKAAKNNQLYWFVALIVVNSAGVLPLLYIFLFQKKRKK